LIKYFKKLSLIRFFERAIGLFAISVALLIITGADLFSPRDCINIKDINPNALREDMFVEVTIEGLMYPYAEQNDGEGLHYAIVTPKNDKDEATYIMSAYIPNKYRTNIEQNLLLNSDKDSDNSFKSFELTGYLKPIESNSKKMFVDGVENLKKSYDIKEANIIYLEFTPVKVDIFDYLSTGLFVIVILWFFWTLIYILSNKNQRRVKKFLSDNSLDQIKLNELLSDAKTFGNFMINDKYISFMIKYRVFLIDRSKIDLIYRLKSASIDDSNKEGYIEEDAIVIKLWNDITYLVAIKPKNISKVMNFLENEKITNE